MQIKLENISASGKTYLIDHSELISKHYNLIPANTIKNNTFLWQNGTETLKMSKFPLKCLDNFSLIHFPEEAYFINFDNILQTGNDLFHNVDYPSYPRYFVDVSHFFTPRRKLHVKGDVYQIENKELLDKFKIFVAHNPTLTKIKIPVYYYYQYELNYQLIGFLNFKTTSKDSAKMEFKHYPLKFLLLNEIITDYPQEMPKMMERLIESLPRYSHNYYYSIVKMNNLEQLSKRRWKFMFGFSNKPTSKCLEEDYDRHNKIIKDVVSKKNAIYDNYNKLVSDIRAKHFKGQSLCCNSSKKKETINLANSILNADYIFGLSSDEMVKDLNNLHTSIFHQSDFTLCGSQNLGAGEEDGTVGADEKEGGNKKSNEFRNPDFVDENRYIKESTPFGNPFKLIIRPKNQSIQMVEMEDEAFITSVSEKKKASKLATFANIYKSEMSKKMKDYVSYYKRVTTDHTIDAKIEALKLKQDQSNLKKIESQKISFLTNGQGGSTMQIEASGAQTTPDARKPSFSEENYSKFDDGTYEPSDQKIKYNFSVSSTAKKNRLNRAEKFLGGFMEANVALFDDLFEIIEGAYNMFEPLQIKRYWLAYYEVLLNKYKDICGGELVKEKVDQISKEYFNIDLLT